MLRLFSGILIVFALAEVGHCSSIFNSSKAILIQSTLQSGATFYVSSGTAVNLTVSTGTAQNFTITNGSFTNINVYGTVGGTASFGKFVQWVSTSNAVGFGTASTTLVQTNLRGQITGVSSSNYIYVCVHGAIANSIAGDCGAFSIFRNGTNLVGTTNAMSRNCAGSDDITSYCWTDTTPASGTNNYAVYIKAIGGGSASWDAVDQTAMQMFEFKP